MRAVDLHCDTIYKLWQDKEAVTLKDNPYSVNLNRLKGGDVTAQCFALFTPTHSDNLTSLTPYEVFIELHNRFEKEIADFPAYIKQAANSSEVAKNEQDGVVSAVLTVEDSVVLEGKEENLSLYKDWGVKIASLTWNWENELGFPQSSDKEIMRKGLKPFGFLSLEFFSENNIIADVSHLSDGGFWDVIAQNVKVCATHSNCRALTDVGRNLTDDMIKALADKGGVVGLNFCASFLSDDGEHKSRISDMVRHVKHLYQKGGEDVLALGSDFDGIGGELEIDGSDKLPLLYEALKKSGFSNRVLNKMWSENALRLLA